MRNGPFNPDHIPRRWTASLLIPLLALAFLCSVLTFGVLRLIEQHPDLTSRIWPAQAGREPPAR